MTTLRPSRYADETKSTFFEASGTLISIHYELVDRSRYLVMRRPPLARLNARIDDGASVHSHEYEVPLNRKVGAEIASIERGLYSFMDEVVRATMQIRALEKTEKDVQTLEEEHLYHQDTASSGPDMQPDLVGTWRQAEQQILDKLTDHLVTAVSHVTNVTSLTPDGLAGYQSERSTALERFTKATSATASLQMHGLLEAVEAYVDYELDAGADLGSLKEKARDYLLQVRAGAGGQRITDEQARIIVLEFAPAYAQLQKRRQAAVRFPRDVVGHAFGSFIGGGFAGFFAIDFFGEAVIRGITGIPINLPGWWLGAGIAFAAPYIRAIHASLTGERQFERRRAALLEVTSRRLQLDWTE